MCPYLRKLHFIIFRKCELNYCLAQFVALLRQSRFEQGHLVFVLISSKRQKAVILYLLSRLFLLFLLVLTVMFLLFAGAGCDSLEFLWGRALFRFLEQDFTICRRLSACARKQGMTHEMNSNIIRPGAPTLFTPLPHTPFFVPMTGFSSFLIFFTSSAVRSPLFKTTTCGNSSSRSLALSSSGVGICWRWSSHSQRSAR